MDKREMERGIVAFAKNAIDDMKEAFFGVQIAVECSRCGQLVDRKHLDTPCGQHPALEEEDPYQQQATVRWNRDAEKPKPEPKPKQWNTITKAEKDRVIDETIARIRDEAGGGSSRERRDGGYQRKPEDRRKLDDFTVRLNNHLAKLAYENPVSNEDLLEEQEDEIPIYRMRND